MSLSQFSLVPYRLQEKKEKVSSPLISPSTDFLSCFLCNQTTTEKLLESKNSMASPHSIIFTDPKP
jgi:hypothetical protein